MFNQIDESSSKLDYIKNTNSVAELIGGEFCETIHRIWDNSLVEYLAASDFRRHVWHSWLSKKANLETNRAHLDFLRFTKSRDIIKDSFGFCPPGFLPALRKLGPSAEEAEFYLNLYELFSRGGNASKLIQHSASLDRDIISNLSGMPNDEFSGHVLSCLIRHAIEPDRYSGAVWIAQLLRETLGELVVIDALNKSSSPLKALRTLLIQLKFPHAPFDFNGELVPLTSTADIRVTAREFRNCLLDAQEQCDMVFQILAGRQFLYRFDGAEPALVQLNRFGPKSWLIDDAKGRSNSKLSKDTQQYIQKLLSKYPSIFTGWPQQQVSPSYIWFYN